MSASTIIKLATEDKVWFTILAIIAAWVTFERHSYTIDEGIPYVLSVKKTWWGFKEERQPVRWSGSNWYVRDKNNRWHSMNWVDGGYSSSEAETIR